MRVHPSRHLLGSDRPGVSLRPLQDQVAAAQVPAPTPAPTPPPPPPAPVASFYANAGIVAQKVITFEGLQDLEEVQNFYNGGAGSLGSIGPNFGITFTGGMRAAIDSDNGGSGDIANEPSPSTVGFFLNAPPTYLNSPTGFVDGIFFQYSSVAVTGTVRVWTEVNGGGEMLGEVTCTPLGANGSGDPTGTFVKWAVRDIPFEGVGKSISFAGTVNQIAFDDIVLFSLQPAQPVVVTGFAPLTVNFHDTSTNSPTSWAWDFQNNGSTDSVLQNPSHTYSTPGVYPVKLTATNAGGNSTVTRPAYIVVMAP